MPLRVRYFGDRQLVASINSGLDRDMSRRGRNVETAAKRLCPVDTGRLRSSIASHVERDSKGPFAVVDSNVNYAVFVEKGARGKQGVHFLERALDAAKQ